MYENFKAAVIGGGLVGALEACMLARQGFKVTIFESRHDGRNEPNYYGRSINLAISHRGISALKRVGLEDIVEKLATPMKARMIHDLKGNQSPIPYDPNGQCIYSIQRAALNNFLLNKAEQEFGVTIVFEHRLVDIDPKQGLLYFRANGGHQNDNQNEMLKRYSFDLIFGCDGARSTVRNLLSRQTKMETSQTFIEHGYLELTIPANANGSFKMAPNYLHIWPRGQFMMIALPNMDHSFTCTLFMPYEIIESIRNPHNRAIEFFTNFFPDAIDLFGETSLIETWNKVRESPLISIKCDPYHYTDKVLLLGDAAHAMVPFYGQGMNCGFEDCLVFDQLLEASAKLSKESNTPIDFGNIFATYSKMRVPNGKSMSDLAMYNYIEMRDLVNTWSFKIRKSVDNTLFRMFPNNWIPLYTMVTFTQIPIDECVRKRNLQDKMIKRFMMVSSLFIFIIICIVLHIVLTM